MIRQQKRYWTLLLDWGRKHFSLTSRENQFEDAGATLAGLVTCNVNNVSLARGGAPIPIFSNFQNSNSALIKRMGRLQISESNGRHFLRFKGPHQHQLIWEGILQDNSFVVTSIIDNIDGLNNWVDFPLAINF